MPKTEFLQIRLSPADRERVSLAAHASHLEPSTWARQAILRAVEDWEAAQAGPARNRPETHQDRD